FLQTQDSMRYRYKIFSISLGRVPDCSSPFPYLTDTRSVNAKMSSLKQENIQNTLKNKRIVKENNLHSLLDQITAQDKNLSLMEQQLKNQKVLRKLYKDKLVQGQVSVIDYLNVIQSYKSAENAKIQMQTNLWLLQNQYEYINW
ncbi:hypothetical protein LCGC14_2950940, partial [marine sediment metagenome]